MATVLGPDMVTITEEPVIIVPGNCYSAGTDFEGHEFFEGPSIRKNGDTYYFVYSSSKMHELCYAVSRYPTKEYVYGGVIVSNCDGNITHQKPAGLPAYVPGNNHGGMAEIRGQWYIFTTGIQTELISAARAALSRFRSGKMVPYSRSR